MLKINTDFKALRREVGDAAPRPSQAAASKRATASAPADAATLTEQHRAIVQANLDASKTKIQTLEDARAISQSLREAIAQHKETALASHEGLTPDRVQSLLQ